MEGKVQHYPLVMTSKEYEALHLSMDPYDRVTTTGEDSPICPTRLMALGQAGHHRGHPAPVPSPTQPFLHSSPYYFSLLHILNIHLPSGALLPPLVAEIRDVAHS